MRKELLARGGHHVVGAGANDNWMKAAEVTARFPPAPLYRRQCLIAMRVNLSQSCARYAARRISHTTSSLRLPLGRMPTRRTLPWLWFPRAGAMSFEGFTPTTSARFAPNKCLVCYKMEKSAVNASHRLRGDIQPRGSETMIAVLLPKTLSARTLPPWSATMCLTMDKPSPVPPASPTLRVRAFSTR